MIASWIKKEERNSIIEICPVRNVVSRFGNKWALLVILVLSEQGTVRFNELCRLIPDVSSRVLSGTLRTLEADGLIARKVYPVVPPKVEYRLTDIGSSLVPFIVQLTEWAQTNMKSIIKHRKKLEAKQME
ncbi:winged helix-turn-helix transcriptional regulator [Parabacteroides johnsonii]|uniref:winged helix-turn-helix transcriptional regulator n=1 Tax=Parabacteroides johnsonii TaxID=387661 RepID=UPI00266B6654|nr:helix-turn-helix domain-containing protein [Parabacteroides johnsonii]